MPHSTHMSGMPRMMSEMKYGIMKAPPPLSAACTGNLRKLPRPMAFPAIARISPILEPHCSRSFISNP